MHYVVKEDISANLVADADSLMREFYRADNEVNNLDQNNVKSASINYDTTFDPALAATCKRGCTRTHLDDASAILYSALTPPVTIEDAWIQSTSSLDLVLATTTPMSIYTSGQLRISSSNPLRADVAIYYNGEILGIPQCFSGAVTSGFCEIPFMLSATSLIPPGACKLSVGVVSRSGVTLVTSLSIAAIGYAR